MIIYFADRNLNIMGQASTNLPKGLMIINDTKTENLDSGTSVFECDINYPDDMSKNIDEVIKTGWYLLRSNENEKEFYTITETEKDTLSQTVRVYAEDGGLDLLNTVTGAYESSTDQSLESYTKRFMPAGWSIGINEAAGAKKLKWDGESTVTERLVSIASYFNCDISYSFEIERLVITKKLVNFHKHRGDDAAKVYCSLNREVKRIVTKKTTENLATALAVTGGTPSGKKSPINLKDYDYSFKDDNGDEYAVDKATGQMRNLSAMRRWSGSLDPDGLILRRFTYDTTNKATLAGKARAALQKICDAEVNYEVEFTKLDASIGDRVYIIDDESEIYLDARILTLSRSVCSKKVSATLGEYLIKDSGLSDRLSLLAKELKDKMVATTVLEIKSSKGRVFQTGKVSTVLSVVITYGADRITDIDSLYESFGDGVKLIWYENGDKLLSTDSRISQEGFCFTIDNMDMTEPVKYECKLEG